MSLQTRIEALVRRLADEFKSVHGQVGSTDALKTTDKSLVGAINELRAQIAAGNAGGSTGGGTGGSSTGGGTAGNGNSGDTTSPIDDAHEPSTSTTFSSAKIKSLLDALKAELTGGTDAALNALRELQSALTNDQTGITTLLTALDKRVRFDAPQTLTPAQQAQARANIGALAADAADDTDFVAIFETALTASQPADQAGAVGA